jgi:hypothetical protein
LQLLNTKTFGIFQTLWKTAIALTLFQLVIMFIGLRESRQAATCSFFQKRYWEMCRKKLKFSRE